MQFYQFPFIVAVKEAITKQKRKRDERNKEKKKGERIENVCSFGAIETKQHKPP